MLSQNVLNPNKKDAIQGAVFHIFYPDLNTAILFDKNMDEPIIFGNKNIVMTQVKNLNVLMKSELNFVVRIYSYILDIKVGYRRIHTYNGPIETIGKYIRRF